MKVIEYDSFLDKRKVTDSAYTICQNAEFPVSYQDVYEHLFENDNSILKLLIDEENSLLGFGVFENYRLFLNCQIVTMLYLSGMVIDPKYQGRNISRQIIKNTYKQLQSDIISLRTQNIAMAKSLLGIFDDNLLEMPGNIHNAVLKCLRQVSPFQDIDEQGVIRDCYPNQLYYDLSEMENNFGIKLQSTDALGVVIEPSKNKQKVLSCFKKMEK